MQKAIKNQSKLVINLIFSLLSIILIWLPLNVSPEYIVSIDSFNFFRLISPFVLILFLFFNRNKIILNKYLVILILIQIISFLSGLFQRGINYDLYWPLIWIITLIFIFNNNILHLFIMSIFVVILMALIQSFIIIKHMVINFSILSYSITSYYDSLLGMPMVRATGISRNIGIFLCLLTYILFDIKIVNKLIKFIVYSLIFIFSFLMYSLSSRGGIICTLISVLFLFYIYRSSFKTILKVVFSICLSFLFFNLLSDYLYSYENNRLNEQISQLNIIKDNISIDDYNDKIQGIYSLNTEIINQKVNRRYDSGLTSGRLDIWQKIVFNNENILFGCGSLCDKYIFNLNSSNVLVYLFSSSGIFGLFLFIYFYYISIKNYFFKLTK